MKFFRRTIFLLIAFATCLNLIEAQGIYSIAANSNFIFYNSGGATKYSISNLNSLLTNANFDNSKKTVFYFYGLTQKPETAEVVDIRNAYVSNGEYNFVLFNLTTIQYVMPNEEFIGYYASLGIIPLLDAGLTLSTLEFVGYSLGAQIAGSVARFVTAYSSSHYKVPRVVGLEPAILSPVNLKSGDASFVMTMHTGNFFSENSVVGDVAFWVNGANCQPMCSIFSCLTCSHSQAQLFWTEAVLTKTDTVFPALKCTSYKDFSANRCNSNTPIGYMNTKTLNSLRGNYYLKTKTYSPYSRATAYP